MESEDEMSDLIAGTGKMLQEIERLERENAALRKQLEAMNELVRANSSQGQGDIDRFVSDYPEIETLSDKLREANIRVECLEEALPDHKRKAVTDEIESRIANDQP
jgi:predicted RNase H-like nuclease (RuvC/YqgF family)